MSQESTALGLCAHCGGAVAPIRSRATARARAVYCRPSCRPPKLDSTPAAVVPFPVERLASAGRPVELSRRPPASTRPGSRRRSGRTTDVRTIVGIDWATDPKRVGLARADLRDGRIEVVEAVRGDHGGAHPREIVSRWVAKRPALLAIDAPLGWPSALGGTLRDHKAGTPIAEPADLLFRRETDRVVQREIGRLPLEVGADRIARTARSALTFLDRVGAVAGANVALGWDPGELAPLAAIEVYPAGTLVARGLQASGYKTPSAREHRAALLDALRADIAIEGGAGLAERDADVLDAIVCVLAARDFLAGDVILPEDRALAEREGWIWVAARRG